MRSRRCRARPVIGAIFLACAILTHSCSKPGDETAHVLDRYALDLAPSVRNAIAYGANDDWHTLADRSGYTPFEYTARKMLTLDNWDDRPEWELWWKSVEPILLRIGAFAQERYGCEYVLQRTAELREADFELLVSMKHLAVLRDSVGDDPSIDAERRVHALIALLPEMDRTSFRNAQAQCRALIAKYSWGAELDEIGIAYLREAFAMFLESDNHHMICQELGTIGSLGGIDDSGRHGLEYWEEGRRLAADHEIWSQWARLSTFIAGHYARTGNLALANQVFNEVLELFDRIDIGWIELRSIAACAKFYDSLQCYDMADAVTDRIRVTMRNSSGAAGWVDRGGPFYVAMAEASSLMRQRDWKAADSVYTSLADRHDSNPGLEPPYYLPWMRGLNQNARYMRTLDVYRRARPHFRTREMQEGRNLLQKAEAEIALGRIDSAFVSLSAVGGVFSDTVPSHRVELCHRDAMMVQVARVREGEEAARSLAEDSFRSLERRVSELTPGNRGYMWIDVNDRLRFALHALVANEPLTRYGIELLWQDLYLLLGSGQSVSGEGVFERARRTARQAQADLEDAMHCMYVVESPRVWRITCTSDGTRIDTLAAEVTGLRASTGFAWDLMSRAPESETDRPSERLVRALAELTKELLPASVATKAPGRLLVTGDGFLRRFPFETLNLSTTDTYEPLALRSDVARVRSTSEPATHPMGGSLIVVDPELSPRAMRRLGASAPLHEARAEGAHAAGILHDPLILEGSAATRTAVTGAWDSAEYIYVAAHAIQDPHIPFLSLLPLAPDEPGEDSFLSVIDIRQSSFAQCEMVVLSGCATGAPYVEATISGASLGDAFVDAGARIAVQTSWDVRDDHARQTMAAFLDRWTALDRNAVAALGEVRRNLMKTRPHPHYWAAYGVSGRLEALRTDPGR